ncbi:MAG: InlB B-repeat-containing protein [Candidatus Bathyarchaeia archaeon]|jgi:hypothetical protein
MTAQTKLNIVLVAILISGVLLAVASQANIGYSHEIITLPPATFYMRSEQQTVNGLTGYGLSSSQGSTASVTVSSETDYENWRDNGYFAIRVFIRHNDGTENELTSGPSAKYRWERDDDSSQGIRTASWNCPTVSIQATDSLIVRLYLAVYSAYPLPDSNYVEKAVFTSGQVGYNQISGSTWTVCYYCWVNHINYWGDFNNQAFCYFGNSPTCYISNIAFAQVSTPTSTPTLTPTATPYNPITPTPTPTPTVTATPQVSLTLGISGQGTTTPSPGTYSYNINTPVTITASPLTGYTFNYWLMQDNSKVYSSTTTVYMSTAKSALAIFTETPQTTYNPNPTPTPTFNPLATPTPAASPEPTPLPVQTQKPTATPQQTETPASTIDLTGWSEPARIIGTALIIIAVFGLILVNKVAKF